MQICDHRCRDRVLNDPIHRAHVEENVRGEDEHLETIVNRLYNRYSLYNAVFNCRGKSRDRRETSIAVFFLSYAPSILEIQTETTMNHVLIDSTRDPLLFPPPLLYIDGEKEKGASRLASQNRFHIAKPGKKGIEAKDGRSFPFVFPLNCILGNWKTDKNG